MTDVTINVPLETDTKVEEVPSILKSHIPEDYIDDDYMPSVFLEDIEGDKEVWLLDCPDMIDLNKLLGKELNFSNENSLVTNEGDSEKCIVVPKKEKDSVVCLLFSCTSDALKTVAIKSAGNIRLNVSYDVPKLGSMIQDDATVPFPKGLKMRHPFLGQGYNSISTERELSTIGKGQGFTSPKKIRKKIQSHQTDNGSPGREFLEDTVGSENEIKLKKIKKEKRCSIYEPINNDLPTFNQRLLQEPVFAGEFSNPSLGQIASEIENREIFSPKKSKKRKRESNYEESAKEEPEELIDITMSEDHRHVSKKIKKEKGNVNAVKDGYANNIMGPRLSNIEAESNLSSAKKKKKHSRSKKADYHVTPEETLKEREEPQVMYDKRERVLTKVMMKENESHPYKPPRLSMNNPQELGFVYEGNEPISKKTKRKREVRCKDEMMSEEGGYSNNIMALSLSNIEAEPKLSKRKKKKKHLHSEEAGYITAEVSREEREEKPQSVYDKSDGVISKLVKKEKNSPHKALRLSMNSQGEDEVSVIYEGSNQNSKKKSKKKRNQLKSEDATTTIGDSRQDNLLFVYDGSVHMLNKNKKTKRRDSQYEESGYIVSEGVEEEVVSFNRNNISSQKIKKEKHSPRKKDSLLLTEDSERFVNPHDGSDISSKKLKKEKKRESHFKHGGVFSESSQEEVVVDDGEHTLKNIKKKKHSPRKVNVLTMDSREETDVAGHGGEHISKKVKKAKRRESQYKDDIEILANSREEATAATSNEVVEKVSKKIKKKKKDGISAMEGLESETNGKDALRDISSFEEIRKEEKPKKRRTMDNAGEANAKEGVVSTLEEDYIGLWIPQRSH